MFKQIAGAAILVMTFTVSTKAQQRYNFPVSGVRNSSGPRRVIWNTGSARPESE